MIERWQLLQRQSLPLEAKVLRSQARIREWYDYWHGNVYIAFSGGKDSTVLVHLVRNMFPDVPAVFADTGLEYPEIKQFIRECHPDTVTIKSTMSFRQVIETYGYPVVSKDTALKIRQARTLPKDSISYNLRMNGIKSDGTYSEIGIIPKKWKFLVNAPFDISEMCCDVMKKKPFHCYSKETKSKPFIGAMASDSRRRHQIYLNQGCNSFNSSEVQSRPLGFWLEDDIWGYIRSRNLEYASVYDNGCSRTGCIFCMFGVHLEKSPNRFQRLKITHPKLYTYCMEKLGIREVLEYIGVPWE